MKKYLLRLITITVFSIYGIDARSETLVTIDNIVYSLNGLYAKVKEYVGGYTEKVTIPETISYNGTTFTVNAVVSKAFYYKSGMNELILPKTVSTIGNQAFHHSGIGIIRMPGVTTIGEWAFADSSIRVVDFVDYSPSREHISIGAYAFTLCNNITYIILPLNTSYNSLSSFSSCDQLQYIISPTHQFPYIEWSENTFDYNGQKPSGITWTNLMPAGFAPINNPEIPELESNAGSYTAYVPFTFANSDMSFSVDVAYKYNINKKELNAKVKDVSRIYGDDNPQFQTDYSGFVNGEDASVITSNGQYTTAATRSSNVGTYSVTQSGAEAQNYSFIYEAGELTVNKAQLTMTANDKNMIYGGQVPNLDASYTGLKNNENKPEWTTTPSITTSATSNSKAGTYPIMVSGGVARNYELSYKNGTLTIDKAGLTIRAENKERLYGDANPEFTLSYSGLRNNENAPEWITAPELETSANRQSPVGEYPITIKNAIATNYDITTSEGILSINKASLSANPVNVTRKYGEDNPQFELTFEGLKNNEIVPEWSTQPVITTNATKKSDVGNYNIVISSADARNYTLTKGVGVMTITKTPLEVGVKDSSKKYGENNPEFELNYSGLLNDETEPVWTELPTFTTEATRTSNVGEYEISASGGVMKNYETASITPGKLTITQSALIIRPQNASRLYFDNNPTFSCTYEGFIGNDNESVISKKPTFTTNATKQSPVGIYQIEANGASAKNYEIFYEKGELIINKRQLTVSTNDYTRTYNENNPTFELYYDGFVNNEDENVLVLKPSVSTIANKNTDAGVYDINISGGFAENYDFNYINGKLTIEKAYQTLTWEQDLSNVSQYEQIELLANASSGLDISYTIEGSQICTITRIGSKTYLDCHGSGETVISAIQEGNNNYWQTTKAYKPLKITSINGISHIIMEIGENCEIYDLNGKRINEMQRGINIIKIGDGTIRKIVVR